MGLVLKKPSPAPADLLTIPQAAALIGVHPMTLRRWHKLGQGPSLVKFNSRVFRYKLSSVRAWIDARELGQGDAS